jgi:hypothetical protein
LWQQASKQQLCCARETVARQDRGWGERSTGRAPAASVCAGQVGAACQRLPQLLWWQAQQAQHVGHRGPQEPPGPSPELPCRRGGAGSGKPCSYTSSAQRHGQASEYQAQVQLSAVQDIGNGRQAWQLQGWPHLPIGPLPRRTRRGRAAQQAMPLLLLPPAAAALHIPARPAAAAGPAAAPLLMGQHPQRLPPSPVFRPGCLPHTARGHHCCCPPSTLRQLR